MLQRHPRRSSIRSADSRCRLDRGGGDHVPRRRFARLWPTRCATTSACFCWARTSATSAARSASPPGLLDEFGVERVHRHPDLRGGVRRRRHRRGVDGRAARGGAAVRRLRHVRLRPDRHGRREDPLARGMELAGGDPHAVGRRRPRRPVPRGLARGLVRGPARAQGRLPGTVEDAYGLLRAAIDDPDPVLVFEHKGLYRRLRDEAPPPGTARRSAARASPGRAPTRPSSRTAPV